MSQSRFNKYSEKRWVKQPPASIKNLDLKPMILSKNIKETFKSPTVIEHPVSTRKRGRKNKSDIPDIKSVALDALLVRDSVFSRSNLKSQSN